VDLDSLARAVRAHAAWRTTSTGLASRALDPAVAARLPGEYLDVLAALGPGEGRIWRRYLRLYPLAEVQAANDAYGVAELAPGLVAIGSTGEGEAYAYDTSAAARPMVRVPFIPLDRVLAREEAPSLAALLAAFVEGPVEEVPAGLSIPDEERTGHELAESTPACLGGVLSLENTVLLPIGEHAELCRFWNRVYRRMRRERQR